MLLTLSERDFIKIQYSSFPLFPKAYPFSIATQLQYYVKREKCKVNDVIFPSGCEARAINLGNKNMKIGIFTGGTSVRSKNIFTDISRYPTGKHEIICCSCMREWGCPFLYPTKRICSCYTRNNLPVCPSVRQSDCFFGLSVNPSVCVQNVGNIVWRTPPIEFCFYCLETLIDLHHHVLKLCKTLGWLVVLRFNTTLTAKVISWRSVTHMCFLAFSHQY